MIPEANRESGRDARGGRKPLHVWMCNIRMLKVQKNITSRPGSEITGLTEVDKLKTLKESVGEVGLQFALWR